MNTNFSPIRNLFLEGRPATVVFVNDTGFIGGAGVAHRRQIQSFLSGGHNVAAVCWLENLQPNPLPPRGGTFPGQWLGLRSFPAIHRDNGLSDSEIALRIRDVVASFKPDLVVFGNLHWASWTIEVIEKISSSGIPSVCYLHDCHWLTGRCAYTGTCRKFVTGCDSSCPSPEEYPSAPPHVIEKNWLDRQRVFCGNNPVPLFANSYWMQAMANSAFRGNAIVRLVPLGLDHQLFSPIDKAVARRLLGLPPFGLLVLAGAVNLKEKRKSGPVFDQLLWYISAQRQARVVAFGAQSSEFKSVISLGQIFDERMMPIIYSAVDILVHTAQEESFGQTLMEAAACGIPSVAFSSGGMVDIARAHENALTATPGDAISYINSVQTLLDDEALRMSLGHAGCRIVKNEYTLDKQYQSWSSNISLLTS